MTPAPLLRAVRERRIAEHRRPVDRCIAAASATRPKSWMTIRRHAKVGDSSLYGAAPYFTEVKSDHCYPRYVLSPLGVKRKAEVLARLDAAIAKQENTNG